jgi:voltage-gated potassium channel Kch
VPKQRGESASERVVPTAKRLDEMSRQDKRRALIRSLTRAALGVSLLLLAYCLLPLYAATNKELVIRLIVAGIVIAGILLWEIQVISRSEFPQLRAADALITGITLLVVVFSSIYLSMSKANVAAFSEPLGRTSAMYFTMTTLTTVGYGDVVAKSDSARISVMIQMVFNVAFIGLAVKWITFTARRRLQGGGTV